ncbi:MAG TPA: exodeoxyribonuclease VII large subunit [Saprospiraceae bacterium]|nr:exodeoxyribonuclease VII large subunit [Saprospiraceae bacterium]
METHSLFELNEYVKRVIALNFPEPLWINCEIAQIKEVRGNVYIDLVEQDELDNIIAQASAVIWYKSYLFIKNKLGQLANALLDTGSHIKVKVNVEFNERYGYKLVIEDIDPTYTLGRLEMHRQKILERLKMEDLLELNKSLKIPTVIQKIAVISSELAAGYKDFMAQILENQYGYQFEIDLYAASMQGQNTEREVCMAIDAVMQSNKSYDVLLIMRGGGSKLDLSFFDNYNIGSKIAKCTLPILTGIGHEIDQSIADIVAHSALKTPTACADYIIERMVNFESYILALKRQISQYTTNALISHHNNLQHYKTIVHRRPFEIIQTHKTMNENIIKTAKVTTLQKLDNETKKLLLIDQTLKVADPKNVLKRGFTFVKQDQDFVTSALNFNKSKQTEITFHDGKIKI